MPRAGNECALDMLEAKHDKFLNCLKQEMSMLYMPWLGKRVCTWHALNIKWTCQGQDHL